MPKYNIINPGEIIDKINILNKDITEKSTQSHKKSVNTKKHKPQNDFDKQWENFIKFESAWSI